MLGYMTQKEARENGFTHHGRYFGIPMWMSPASREAVTKWAPMDFVVAAVHLVEGFLRSAFYPNRRPVARLMLGPEIERGQVPPKRPPSR